MRLGLGLLLGLLLAVGPLVESVAATHRPCGQAPGQPAVPAETTSIAVETTSGLQWTCPDRAATLVFRAHLSERPDGPGHGGGAVSLHRDTTPTAWGPERTAAEPSPGLLSSVPTFLRSTVLQI